MQVAVVPGVGPRQGLSGAESRFVDLLGSWTGEYAVAGLAFVNVSVPHSHTGRRQVDAVVATPTGVVVVEVKGFHTRQQGILAAPLNGSWTVDGAPAMLHTQVLANPWQQLDTNLYAVKNALSDAGLDPGFVAGLVVLVPAQPGDIVLPRQLPGGRGTTLVLAEQTPLRRYFHRHARRRPTWNAADVLRAARALDLAEFAPSADDLRADGFDNAPATAQPALPAEPDPGTARETPPDAVPPVDADDTPTPPRGLELPTENAPDAESVAPAPVAARTRTLPRPTASPRAGHVAATVLKTAAALAGIAAIVILAVFIHSLFH